MRNYRGLAGVLLVLALFGAGVCGWAALVERIPDRMYVSEEGELPQLFPGLVEAQLVEETDAQESTQVSSESVKQQEVTAALAGGQGSRETSYSVSYRLFGKLPLKEVEVTVQPRRQVYVGGTPIGIYLETDGVLVVDTGTITDSDGKKTCPAQNIVQSGDYIQAVNGTAVSTKEELISCINQCGGEALLLDVQRDGKKLDLQIQPVLDDQGDYRAGIWVRNDTQGIGTLTYVDPEGNFGALGHGISDIDTGELLEVQGGTLYDAEVVSIVKGRQGSPGEVAGIIHYSEGYKIGTITANQGNGIYGTVSSLASLPQELQLCEVAHRQEVKEGEAQILCCVGGEVKEYQVELKEVRLTGSDENKNLVLEVTDPELLDLTGGIIQGMSGSPILQNGRIVGAVTHVFVNDPTKGYGILLEDMLE
jgi:stage IV sporulation protein B